MPEGTSLTPVAFLERAARVFRDKVAVVDGSRRLTYGEFADRARRLAGNDYDTMLAQAPPISPVIESEHRLMSISYTSGTTGSPKGVMHTHQGTYLQTLAMVHHCALTADTRYLWTLPMFHCHGWANTWAITAAGGTHVCLRTFSPATAWGLIREHEITHLSAAPTVLTMMLTEHGDGPALIRPDVPLDGVTRGEIERGRFRTLNQAARAYGAPSGCVEQDWSGRAERSRRNG